MNDWDVWEHGQTSPLIADDVLRPRIAESVAWCESLAGLADCRPSRFPQNLLHDGPDHLVCSIGRDRQSATRARKLATERDGRIVVPGRFMLHFPDENLTDGAAEVQSDGFFDVWNLPPIDTWVSFFFDGRRRHTSRRYLLCYVPRWAVTRADAGIEVNPEDCIAWLDRTDVAARGRVEALTRAS
jgi:hypothetical protein